MTAASQVSEFNAYRFSDNYQIVRTSDQEFMGCEHNKQEAEAIAKYLSGRGPHFYSVICNSKDAVRAAKGFRKEPVRVKEHVRQEAFKELKVI